LTAVNLRLQAALPTSSDRLSVNAGSGGNQPGSCRSGMGRRSARGCLWASMRNALESEESLVRQLAPAIVRGPALSSGAGVSCGWCRGDARTAAPV